MPKKIIAFAGSTRKGSYNDAALSLAVAGARAAGAEVEHIQLRDYPMPIYDADEHHKHGAPKTMLALRVKMLAAQGFLIASPEYNASITPLLKNTIDWLSQSVDGQSGRLPFEGKITGLLGASAGAFGTIRALPHVSYILSNLGAIVLPILAVPKADQLLKADGSVGDERAAKNLHALGAQVVQFIQLG
jgi:chromate reductase, NAD(P)H dehydrogenase (quinone)